jgi:hypothetical protein
VSDEGRIEDLLDRWEDLRRRVGGLEEFDGFLGVGPSPEAGTGPEDGRADFRAGRYRATHLHARGGLGEVFVAGDEELRRVVALKRLQPGRARDLVGRARFRREAE